MEPFLLDGDELIVNTSPNVAYAVGDIVLYRSPRQLKPIAHRLVWVDRTASTVVIRSDAEPLMVESLGKEAILGKVEYARRGERLVRVNGTTTTRLYNLGVARLRPSALRIKHAVTLFLLPAVMWFQRTSMYRCGASKLFSPDIRVIRPDGSDEARIIATVNGRYAGSLDMHPRCLDGTNVGWVSSLSVRVRYRGAGIAVGLLEAVERYAEEVGIQELRAEYDQGNRPAEQLYGTLCYQQMGQSRTGVRPELCAIRKILTARNS